MMLTEVTAVPGAALPVEALKDHLRMGAGFALPVGQDGLLESYLRAAMAAIEGRIAKALIARRFRWSVEEWRDPAEVALPVAPVSVVVGVTLVDALGGAVLLPATAWRLLSDLHRPRLVGAGSALPTVPAGGQAVVEFDAGFGPAWGDVPADLQQAVLLLAAEYYEHRHDDGSSGAGLPFGVVTLIERWRQVRILGGGGRK
ncbi:MAG: hypothetical protein IPL38_19510 [Rhodobacter sp.]|jgi:uncharacterized phiE125 gp8 family phage protein|nr:hypothetical protein [Rhodobacter sp.]MBK8441586.1 hypothetical protein [Rhodobacter sp.]